MHNSFLQRRGTATLFPYFFFFFFFFFLLKISYFSSRGSLFYYFKVQYKASNPESRPQTLQGHQWHQALQPPSFFLPVFGGSSPLFTVEGLLAVWDRRVYAEGKKGKPGGGVSHEPLGFRGRGLDYCSQRINCERTS